jgi:hypothetical protein
MDSRSVIEQAQPGDAMFYSCGNTQSTMGHVDLIYSIDQDQLNRTNGTGRIQTIDTNTPTEFGTLTLRNWNFTNYYSLEGCSQAKYMWLGKSK